MKHLYPKAGRKRWYVGIVAAILLVAATATGLAVYLTKPALSASFPTNANGLNEAKTSEAVVLKNGASYAIDIKPVKRTIAGKSVRMLGYNGMVPGPTITVHQGDSITLNIKNGLDTDTTIHPHGVNGANSSDGVPDSTQSAIKSGESYQQKLTFPDIGLYWYHPHIREDYTQASGLYANFVVLPKDLATWPAVDDWKVLTLSDIALDSNGIAPFSRTLVDHTLMGRYGTTQLINGTDRYTSTVASGTVVRYFLTNTASVRPFKFTIPNAKLKLIGADNGFYEQEKFVDSVTLAPSERAIVDVYFPTAGNYTIQNATPDKTYDLGTITATGVAPATSEATTRFNVEQTHADVTASMAKYVTKADSAPDKRVSIQLKMDNALMGMMAGGSGSHMMSDGSMMGGSSMSGMMDNGSGDGIEWEDGMTAMNAKSNTKNLKWSLQDLDSSDGSIDWKFKKGDVVKIQVTNEGMMHPMQHPIHIHGQRFIVTAIDGVKQTNLVWKDSVLIPNGHKYDLVVAMENPGNWLIHCHIPEHMEAGMMGKFSVTN